VEGDTLQNRYVSLLLSFANL